MCSFKAYSFFSLLFGSSYLFSLLFGSLFSLLFGPLPIATPHILLILVFSLLFGSLFLYCLAPMPIATPHTFDDLTDLRSSDFHAFSTKTMHKSNVSYLGFFCSFIYFMFASIAVLQDEAKRLSPEDVERMIKESDSSASMAKVTTLPPWLTRWGRTRGRGWFSRKRLDT